MRNAIHKAINKTLTYVLCLMILGNMGVAVWQTHVYAPVTITFGNAPDRVLPAIRESELQPTARDLERLVKVPAKIMPAMRATLVSVRQ